MPESPTAPLQATLTYKEALALIEEETKPLPKIVLPLSKLISHALFEPIVAPFDLPQFDNSQVDGYGVKVADLVGATAQEPRLLKLVGAVKAGSAPSFELEAGQALKIFTGGTVPPSVEAILMKEYCQELDGAVQIQKSPSAGENIRRRGGEFLQGETLLAKGELISPPVIGLIASLGFSSFAAFDKPQLSIIATGDELVEPGQPLLTGQIYDANSYALRAAAESLGLKSKVQLVKDDLIKVREVFAEALQDSDVIISSGGVSVGEFDFVKTALESLGVKTIFWKVAIKPGKPLYFGILENNDHSRAEQSPRRKLIFGLPGNTVSTLVTFHQFVKPALKLMMGQTPSTVLRVKANLKNATKKNDARLDFMRGRLSEDLDGQLEALPTKGQQSHMLSGLAQANCLIHFPLELDSLQENDRVVVDLLKWFD
jgi:molybdopterin molybdotransferase